MKEILWEAEPAHQEPGSFICLIHHPQHFDLQLQANALMWHTLLWFLIMTSHNPLGGGRKMVHLPPICFLIRKKFFLGSPNQTLSLSQWSQFYHMTMREPVTCKRDKDGYYGLCLINIPSKS